MSSKIPFVLLRVCTLRTDISWNSYQCYRVMLLNEIHVTFSTEYRLNFVVLCLSFLLCICLYDMNYNLTNALDEDARKREVVL